MILEKTNNVVIFPSFSSLSATIYKHVMWHFVDNNGSNNWINSKKCTCLSIFRCAQPQSTWLYTKSLQPVPTTQYYL